jgi:hypothetical protein
MFYHFYARTQLSEWVSRAQYLPDKRNLHMRVLSGDYYWFMTTQFYDLFATISKTDFTKFFCSASPPKAPNRKTSLTFGFDKLWHLSKSVHTGENSQILTVSNKKKRKIDEKNKLVSLQFLLMKIKLISPAKLFKNDLSKLQNVY